MTNPRLYPNGYPGLYEAEQANARSAGYAAVPSSDPDFILIAASSDQHIYVLTQDGELIIGLQSAVPGPGSHAVLAEGGPVLAAGEVWLLVTEDTRMVIELNNKSGHYMPDAKSLELAADAFRSVGFEVDDTAISPTGMD